MASVNEFLRDEAIRHAVDLQQHSNQTVRRIMAVLNRSDDRLFVELTAALQRLEPSSFTVERLESLLFSVRSVNSAAFLQAGQELSKELRGLVEYEAAYQRQAIASVLPVQVQVAAISAEMTYAAAVARPFQGVLLQSVLKDLEGGKAKRIRQAVAQGYVENKTTSQIVQALRGTRVNGYADGLLEGSRRDVEAVTRTALGHMAGFTQDRFLDANVDLIKAVVWSSTLDTRTSEICMIRDGLQYAPVTHKPMGHVVPWLAGPGRAHWRCRSHQTTILKSYKELGIDIPEVIVEGKTRASIDGQVPSATTYGDWLGKQSAARQAEVLGPARTRLMRQGKLSMKDMYSNKGQFLTLDELRLRDAAVFKKVGL